jgi:hypothetical protein
MESPCPFDQPRAHRVHCTSETRCEMRRKSRDNPPASCLDCGHRAPRDDRLRYTGTESCHLRGQAREVMKYAKPDGLTSSILRIRQRRKLAAEDGLLQMSSAPSKLESPPTRNETLRCKHRGVKTTAPPQSRATGCQRRFGALYFRPLRLPPRPNHCHP